MNLRLWRHWRWFRKFTVRSRPIRKEIASSMYNNLRYCHVSLGYMFGAGLSHKVCECFHCYVFQSLQVRPFYKILRDAVALWMVSALDLHSLVSSPSRSHFIVLLYIELAISFLIGNSSSVLPTYDFSNVRFFHVSTGTIIHSWLTNQSAHWFGYYIKGKTRQQHFSTRPGV